MRWNRASPKDAQSEVRTKISDAAYTQLVELAAARGSTVYKTARDLLLYALAKQALPCDGHPKSTETGDFGTVRGTKEGMPPRGTGAYGPGPAAGR